MGWEGGSPPSEPCSGKWDRLCKEGVLYWVGLILKSWGTGPYAFLFPFFPLQTAAIAMGSGQVRGHVRSQAEAHPLGDAPRPHQQNTAHRAQEGFPEWEFHRSSMLSTPLNSDIQMIEVNSHVWIMPLDPTRQHIALFWGTFITTSLTGLYLKGN